MGSGFLGQRFGKVRAKALIWLAEAVGSPWLDSKVAAVGRQAGCDVGLAGRRFGGREHLCGRFQAVLAGVGRMLWDAIGVAGVSTGRDRWGVAGFPG